MWLRFYAVLRQVSASVKLTPNPWVSWLWTPAVYHSTSNGSNVVSDSVLTLPNVQDGLVLPVLVYYIRDYNSCLASRIECYVTLYRRTEIARKQRLKYHVMFYTILGFVTSYRSFILTSLFVAAYHMVNTTVSTEIFDPIRPYPRSEDWR